MTMMAKVATFSDRFVFVGPAFWQASIQYYIVQIVVAAAWQPPYSWLHNPISDLGNTGCGSYAQRYVCSPLHATMNASFMILGLTMMLGAILIYQEFKTSQGSWVGFSFMGLAGLGTLLVGLFPENTIASLHFLGALLPFVIGNLGLIVLGLALDLPTGLRRYTLASGFISLTAAGLFVSHHYFVLGVGGMERLATYPQTMWLIVFGVYMSRNHYRSRQS